MKHVFMAAGAAMLALTVGAHAQQPIQWKQVLNLPKGLNQPPGIKLDVLGIEPGDSYPEVKAKLEALLKEAGQSAQAPKPAAGGNSAQDAMNRMLGQMSGQSAPRPPITEIKRIIRFSTPGGSIEAEYVGEVHMERKLKGKSGKIVEMFTVLFSAPSSGHQALSIRRHLSYDSRADQPRVSEVMASVTQKLKGQPIPQVGGGRFLYDNGRQLNKQPFPCVVGADASNPQMAQSINPNGACDLAYDVRFVNGISNDHAATAEFIVTDAERAKQDILADFAFFDSYVKGIQNRTGGAAPKL